MIYRFFIILLALNSLSIAESALIHHASFEGEWDAFWISHPVASLTDYGVFHFRRTFELESRPDRFIIHVSADNRYKLYVNGRFVTLGPARGNLLHWRYESLDIAPYLKEGTNSLAAAVWNFADLAPWAQISSKTAFMVQGDGETERIVNTNDLWRAYHNSAYQPLLTRSRYSHVVGPGEVLDASLYPWGWQESAYENFGWDAAMELFRAVPYGRRRYSVPWTLVPRDLPAMEHRLQRIPKIARSSLDSISEGILTGEHSVIIPAGTSCSILLDQTHLTNAYVHLIVSQGRE